MKTAFLEQGLRGIREECWSKPYYRLSSWGLESSWFQGKRSVNTGIEDATEAHSRTKRDGNRLEETVLLEYSSSALWARVVYIYILYIFYLLRTATLVGELDPMQGTLPDEETLPRPEIILRPISYILLEWILIRHYERNPSCHSSIWIEMTSYYPTKSLSWQILCKMDYLRIKHYSILLFMILK